MHFWYIFLQTATFMLLKLCKLSKLIASVSHNFANEYVNSAHSNLLATASICDTNISVHIAYVQNGTALHIPQSFMIFHRVHKNSDRQAVNTDWAYCNLLLSHQHPFHFPNSHLKHLAKNVFRYVRFKYIIVVSECVMYFFPQVFYVHESLTYCWHLSK